MRMRRQAERFGAEFIEKNASKVNLSAQPIEISSDGKKYLAKSVIVATGAETRWLEIPGEKELIGKGVSSCAPCDAPFFKSKNVAVVGGGDSAMEEALVLSKYASQTFLLHRRDEFRASVAMQKKVLANEGIDIFHCTEVLEVEGANSVHGIDVKSWKGSKNIGTIREKIEKHKGKIQKEDDEFVYWHLPLQGMFVAIGHIPSTSIFSATITTDEKGYIKKENPMQNHNGGHIYHSLTNIPGVFVAGDVHDHVYRQAITAAGFGCMAAMDCLKYLDKQAPHLA